MFEDYRDIISRYVQGRHGVYALYNDKDLYYVGLASNMRSRLHQHLKDKHAGRWNRFSAYLTVSDGHMKELESLLLRIANPKGNRQSGKFVSSQDLRPRLQRDMRQEDKAKYAELLGRTLRQRKGRSPAITSMSKVGEQTGRTSPIANRLKRNATLWATYNGVDYTARLRLNGSVRWNGKTYASPTEAAKAIKGGVRANGWWFWFYEHKPGEWVRLRELKNGQ